MKILNAVLLSSLLLVSTFSRTAPSKDPMMGPVVMDDIVDNTPRPSFLNNMAYVALFFAAAYLMHKMIPPIPEEQSEENLTKKKKKSSTAEIAGAKHEKKHKKAHA